MSMKRGLIPFPETKVERDLKGKTPKDEIMNIENYSNE